MRAIWPRPLFRPRNAAVGFDRTDRAIDQNVVSPRAEILIQGYELEASNLHFYYVGMEIVKVVCLLIFGIKLFKT